MTIDPLQIVLVVVCLALGGILKGATGAGAPILAVPALAAVFNVKLAVVIMMMPNLLPNMLQCWRFRHDRMASNFAWIFAGAGAVGAGVGTAMLASLPHETLSLIVAGGVLCYVVLRLAKPGWKLPFDTATRFAAPAGFAAGILQGSSGISAPISISYLNAMRMKRETYIFTISTFFTAMTLVQIPTLAFFGLLTPGLLGLSMAAVVPILAFMPVGAALARRLSPTAFDRAILLLLVALAIKLVYEAVV